jgi:chaperonin GroES
MSVHPIRDQIVVKVEAAKKQEGLIIRPDNIEEKLAIGRVVAIGSGRVTMNGAIIPLDVSVGDQIRFNKNMAAEISHGGETVYVLREDNVTCVLR